MNLENVMSKDLVVVNINDTIGDVAQKMKTYDVGFVPVEQNKHIVGVITDRDIVVKGIANHAEASAKVETYMTKNVFHIDQSDDLIRALELMTKEKIKRLVINNQDKIVGILSWSDLIQSDLPPETIMENLKKLWEIKENEKIPEAEIDEFYL